MRVIKEWTQFAKEWLYKYTILNLLLSILLIKIKINPQLVLQFYLKLNFINHLKAY